MEINTFEETGIGHELLKAVKELGFETPTPIQKLVIPFMLSQKRDLLAYAQTGTGKTAAFGLPIIQKIDPASRITQAIILSPTRELCVQIARDMEDYGKYTPGLNVTAVYGGANIMDQISKLKRGSQIVVGTPGRVLDLIKRRQLKIENVDFLVLDEADEMLSMGFKDELDDILSETPQEKQTLLFSATMLKEVKEIAYKYMNDPEELGVGKKNVSAENVSHHYYLASFKNKYLALKRIADIYPNIYGIVFCRTRSETKEVADKLIQDGYNADALHGDLSQSQRDMVMKRFRIKNIQLLVATDVAARGLDVSDLTHIINYNLPQDSEIYIHRSGRTGRAGKSGISILLMSSRDQSKLRQIERVAGCKFEAKRIPTGRDICEKQLFHLIDKVEKVEVDEKEIGQFLPAIISKLAWLDREELIKRFVSMEFNQFSEYYKDTVDINEGSGRRDKREDSGERSERGERGERSERRDHNNRDERRTKRDSDGDSSGNFDQKRSNTKFSRIFINVGSKDNLAPRDLINLVNDEPELRSAEIGKIEILRKFSFFEIESKFDKKLQELFTGRMFNEVSMAAEIALPKTEGEEPQKRDRRSSDSFPKERREYKRSDSAPTERKEYKRSDSAPTERKEYKRSDSAPTERREYKRSDSAPTERKEYKRSDSSAPKREYKRDDSPTKYKRKESFSKESKPERKGEKSYKKRER
jgi:ATP-dependent RNA helicase DeaD